MPDTNSLDNPPAAVIRFLDERVRTGTDGKAFFLDDDGNPILDTHREGCPNADARAVALWSCSRKPELWSKPEPVSAPQLEPAKLMSLAEQWWRARYQMDEPAPMEATAPKSVTVPESPPALTGMAATMAAVNRGELSVADAVARHLGARASAAAIPATTADLWVKARDGDAAALATLRETLNLQGSVR